MSFADRLKEARRISGLSQEDLAEQLDVSRQAVGKWEQGQSYPEVETLLALCGVLNTSLDALMADELPKNCRTEIKAPAPSESILIRAENGIDLVRCIHVKCSQPYKSRRGPKYALFGISNFSALSGPHSVLLGWYADEASVQAEIKAIQEAMRRGEGDYVLQYNVQVRRKLGMIEMIDK